MAPNINMRTHGKTEKEIEDDGVAYEKDLLAYKRDVNARINLSVGHFIRAKIKKNISLFNRNQGVNISDSMRELAGEEDTFEVVNSDRHRDDLGAVGFGYTWHLDWLEDINILGHR